jgi:hypothetical protein
MARKTTTTHSCDRCGKTVERPRDLRRFTLTAKDNRWHELRVDLCRPCEDKTLDEFGAWASVEGVDQVRREPIAA